MAHCVALGDQAAAGCFLELEPSLHTAYARDLVKYCSLRKNDIQGQPTAAWERILLGKIAASTSAEAFVPKLGQPVEVLAHVRSRGRL